MIRMQSLAWAPDGTARRLYRLVEPVHLVTYFADEPTDALLALGLRNYWDGYFAGRAAPLGRVPAGVIHAVFYNFADGEAARHIPRVWDIVTPEAALAAREQGCVAALRRILGPLAGTPGLPPAADLAAKAATSAPTEGRILYAALRGLPLPQEPVARLWHAATLLREHRGDGHIAALVAAGIGGTEAHVLHALSESIPAEKFGRVHHLPADRLTRVVDGMRARGLIDASGWLSDAGWKTKEGIGTGTDELAAPPYASLEPSELDQLIADLEPITAALDAAGSRLTRRTSAAWAPPGSRGPVSGKLRRWRMICAACWRMPDSSRLSRAREGFLIAEALHAYSGLFFLGERDFQDALG